MAVRALSGYDPDTGWPPDDSTGVQWDPDTDIPGQFGRGGFRSAPQLTAPASGPPPGVSLSGPGGTAAPTGPDVVPPTNAPLRPGASPAIRPGGFGPATDATIPSGGGGGLFSRLTGFLPSLFSPTAAGVAAPAAIAAAGYKYGEPGRAKLTVDPRIDAAGSGGFDVGQPLGAPGGPDASSPNAGAPTPFQQPDHPSTMRYPSWPTPPAPTGVDATIPPFTARPVTPTPATAYPPVRPKAAPLAAGPAATRQQPNLGNYGPFTTVPRPNANPGIGGGMLGGNSGMANIGGGGARGAGGAPTMTALDLSRLFSRQQ